MTRQEILQQIAALDKQINEVAGKDRVARGGMGGRSFPMGNWVATAFFAGAWMFGGAIPQIAELHRQWAWAVLIVAVVFAISSLIRTFVWLVKPRDGANKKLAEAMEKTRGMQLQRQELQRRLAEIDKKI